MTAAVYASRAKLRTALFEKLMPGGQIAVTDLVENYPGFPEGILGPEIARLMEEQAKKYGTSICYEEVTSVRQRDNLFEVVTPSGVRQGRAVILASGASFRMLKVPGETSLTGKGVSYCATCDGAFFKGMDILVVGGGDSAIQEGLFLTRFAKTVTIVHRRDKLRASPILQERAKNHPGIRFLWDTVVVEIKGEKRVESVVLRNLKKSEQYDKPIDGVFIFIGHDPNTGFLGRFVELDENRYIKCDSSFQTSVAGVFAAGEVRSGATRQLVAACGEGCAAALAVQAFLEV